ncbi:hypothetical protein FKM82_001692 [Ascaphus truei]
MLRRYAAAADEKVTLEVSSTRGESEIHANNEEIPVPVFLNPSGGLKAYNWLIKCKCISYHLISDINRHTAL